MAAYRDRPETAVQALNLFIDDIYHEQRVIRGWCVPARDPRQLEKLPPAVRRGEPATRHWAHICGSDLVRDKDGTVYVLEDNLRVPSGVSYMLENRLVMKRVFPELFEQYRSSRWTTMPSQLYDMLCSLSPRRNDKPEVVVLTPGIYNSAYFEHSYLAQQMGAELVEGRDLVVGKDDCVYMRTIEGLARVDVIYRRIDDLFLDPEAFNPESTLGVPGLLRAWKATATVALANAPGAASRTTRWSTPSCPTIIEYYLGEEAILPNVPTHPVHDHETDREYVLANLDKLVVKPANESGGYGMLIGPHASNKERERVCTD